MTFEMSNVRSSYNSFCSIFVNEGCTLLLIRKWTILSNYRTICIIFGIVGKTMRIRTKTFDRAFQKKIGTYLSFCFSQSLSTPYQIRKALCITDYENCIIFIE